MFNEQCAMFANVSLIKMPVNVCECVVDKCVVNCQSDFTNVYRQHIPQRSCMCMRLRAMFVRRIANYLRLLFPIANMVVRVLVCVLKRGCTYFEGIDTEEKVKREKLLEIVRARERECVRERDKN